MAQTLDPVFETASWTLHTIFRAGVWGVKAAKWIVPLAAAAALGHNPQSKQELLFAAAFAAIPLLVIIVDEAT